MLRSPAYFDAFFGTLPQTLAMYKEHEELLKANEELVGAYLFLQRGKLFKQALTDVFLIIILNLVAFTVYRFTITCVPLLLHISSPPCEYQPRIWHSGKVMKH